MIPGLGTLYRRGERGRRAGRGRVEGDSRISSGKD